MTRVHRDIGAMLLTALAVVVLAATDRGWGVPLVGGSHRWAAGVVLLLGMAACSLGSSRSGAGARLLAGLGTVSLVLALIAIATGSLQALTLAVAAFVALWVGSALRHMLAGRPAPPATV
jgi:hypothetical protein